ncbi:MAG: sulfatase [Acidimicrobiales bacterium]|nr:sulfatase-like hydrolase/transferase [Hyphomonadaceae bacterium]RZV41952.1 MAG: sulfatase [Acidimicrobiales bacterium]
MTLKTFTNTVLALPLLAFGACSVETSQADHSPPIAESISAKAGSPNILFILVDDLGYGQLGVTGHPIIKTPNIDKLAENGILFTQAYAGSTVCSPSRISLMTGKDVGKLHSNANTIKLRPEDKTLAHMMSGAGYKTALFGKFGIGSTFGKTDPMAMGFQNWYGLLHNITAHRQYPTMIFRDNDMEFVSPNVAGAEGAYAQELFTDAAIDYISEQDETNPFFVFLSYTSPHAELAAPQEFVEPYSGKFDEVNYPGLSDPDNKPKFADYYPKPVSEPTATQAGMVTALDHYVGEVMSALEAQGLAENTIVFFSSDNGPHEEGGADPIEIRASGPYRGGKRDLYDGGIHVPLIAHWPAKIEGGRISDTPMAFADVLPTLADLVDAPQTAMVGLDPNGTSVLPILVNPDAELAERVLYWEFAQQLGDPNSGVIGTVKQAARRGDWKVVRLTEDSDIELYNIIDDKSESQNLAAQFPEIAQEFTAMFDQQLRD